MLTHSHINRINRLLAHEHTFALVLMPGSHEPLWFGDTGAETEADEGAALDITPWLGRFRSRMTIEQGTPAKAAPLAPMAVETEGTTLEEYTRGATAIIDACRQRGGKTVFSRTICGQIPGEEADKWGEKADALFSRFPDTLRYILYSPQTQGWMGATPEILADYTFATGTLATVALAGTRPRTSDTSTAWDDKNLRENRFVADYIIDTLTRLGLRPEPEPLDTVAYGNIEHLCARISCPAPRHMLGRIVDSLNPTPALCGYPVDEAVADIGRHERHRRNLYGGVIAVADKEGYHAYVNLRCVHFSGPRYCIYGGGGIVAQSRPDDEFAETEAKTAFLRQLLGRKSVVNP